MGSDDKGASLHHRLAQRHLDACTLRDIERLGPWSHNVHLPGGITTCPALGDFPAATWRAVEPTIPANLRGWRVLDVGCNAGFYSFELAKRGATVLGIDSELLFLRQARWAAEKLGLEERIAFEQRWVYDLARDSGLFDVVLFLGVFQHLRYPLLGLDIVRRKTKRLLVLQAMTDAVESMLRSTGLLVKARPREDLYVCEPDHGGASSHWTWNESEYAAAVGLSRASGWPP